MNKKSFKCYITHGLFIRNRTIISCHHVGNITSQSFQYNKILQQLHSIRMWRNMRRFNVVKIWASEIAIVLEFRAKNKKWNGNNSFVLQLKWVSKYIVCISWETFSTTWHGISIPTIKCYHHYLHTIIRISSSINWTVWMHADEISITRTVYSSYGYYNYTTWMIFTY